MSTPLQPASDEKALGKPLQGWRLRLYTIIFEADTRAGQLFDRWLIDDTFACRTGRGRLAAIDRAAEFARSRTWHLQMDMRKYFEHIDHEVLLALLGRRFGDPELLALFSRIVRTHAAAPGRG